MATCVSSPSNPDCHQWDNDGGSCEAFTSHHNDCTFTPAVPDTCTGDFGPFCHQWDGDDFDCNLNSDVCVWLDPICDTLTTCGGFGDQSTCEFYGCSWVPGSPSSCDGTLNCSDQTAEGQDACAFIDGCIWATGRVFGSVF